jgi:long-chain acyl-CoA synthetase
MGIIILSKGEFIVDKLKNFGSEAHHYISRKGEFPLAFITDRYQHHASLFPAKIAIQTQHAKLTYSEWNKTVEKTAAWLESLEETNKTIGLLLPNGIELLQLFAGACEAGWIAVLFDPKWKEAEIKERLAIARPSVLIAARKLAKKAADACSKILILEDCLEEIEKTSADVAANPKKMAFPPKKTDERSGNLPFYMGFTSGTTGNPKAFLRSHDSWLTSFLCNRADFQMDETERVLIPGALIHSHFLYGAISTLHLGGTVFLMEKFSSEQTLAILENEDISTVFVVPTMVQAFLKTGGVIRKPLKMISSGAKWDADSKRSIRNMFPRLTMFEFYGASELSFVTVLNDHDNRLKPGSVGRPCFGVEVQIRRSEGGSAKPNEIGKIYVKSGMVFIGYLQEDSGTIRTSRDAEGWVTVDDMGFVDEDGYLYIAGREKNMILYGGINLFPEEIEKVIAAHPDVEEVAVVGLDDPYWGQIAAAAVVGRASKKELVSLCKSRLSSYKIPRKWFFIDEMPYTTSGKIARAKLKEQLESAVVCHV